MKLKKCWAALAAVACGAALMIGLLPAPANAALYLPPDEETAVNSKAAYLYNLDTDTALYEREPHMPLPPASIVKIMTCALALENTEDLDAEMVEYPQHIFSALAGLNPSQADVRPGEELTMRKALYCLMLQSDCYSALAIAENVCDGDGAAFVAMMNEKAQELGAVNTVFTNPHGLYIEGEDMHTTAYDMALITKYAYKLDGFMDICTTTTIDIAPTTKHASDYRLFSTMSTMIRGSDFYYEPIQGVKTGSLPEVGANYVSIASRDGYNYLLVLMGAQAFDAEGEPLEKRYEKVFTDAKTIYEWAFDNFQIRTLYKKGDTAGEVKVNLSKDEDHVSVLAAKDFSALVPIDAVVDPESGDGIVKRLHLPETVDAPVQFGKKLGTMDVVVYGDVVGTIDLLAQKDIPRSQSKYILSKVKEAFSGFWVKFVVILVLLVLVFYVTLMVLRNRYRKRYRRARGHKR